MTTDGRIVRGMLGRKLFFGHIQIRAARRLQKFIRQRWARRKLKRFVRVVVSELIEPGLGSAQLIEEVQVHLQRFRRAMQPRLTFFRHHKLMGVEALRLVDCQMHELSKILVLDEFWNGRWAHPNEERLRSVLTSPTCVTRVFVPEQWNC